MPKVWLVAKREYLYNLRRPAFVFAAFIMPLISIAALAVVFTLLSKSESNAEGVGSVGYVDQSGVLAAAVNEPDFFASYAAEAEARAALDGGDLGAVFVLPPDYLATGSLRLYTVAPAPDALREAIDDFLLANLSARLEGGLPLERLQNPVALRVHILESGRNLPEDGIFGLLIVPFALGFIFFMSAQISGSFLMSSVVEEKANRIMEVLITSVTPLQMLVGKIIGLGALGLTQLALWALAGMIALRFRPEVDVFAAVSVPADLALIAIVYFALNYFLQGGVLAGIGVTVGAEQESRQVGGVISLIAVLPFILLAAFIENPNGTLPVILSLVPFTAPLAMIFRMALTAVPVWQVAASLALLALATAFVVWMSARVFRWASLLYGKRPTPRELIRVMRHVPGAALRPAKEGQHEAPHRARF